MDRRIVWYTKWFCRLLTVVTAIPEKCIAYIECSGHILANQPGIQTTTESPCFPFFLMRWQQKKGLKTPTKHSNSTRFIQLDTAIGQLSSHFEGQRLVAHFSFLFPRKLCKLTDNENRDQFKISEVLYTNVGRTYDTTSVVRPMSATIRPIHQSGL